MRDLCSLLTIPNYKSNGDSTAVSTWCRPETREARIGERSLLYLAA